MKVIQMKKKVLAGILVCVAVFLTACESSNDSYKEYQEAYQAMSAPGSLNADVQLSLVTDEETVKAQGNMKMNQEGAMYYEMNVGSTKVTQFLKDGILYSEINGVKTTYDTSNQKNERQKTDEGQAEKEEGNGFTLRAFLEEFASMIEAGKIKEMGILDPINQNAIKKITVTDDGSGKSYSLEVSDSLAEKLFNTMIKEQVSDQEYALQFSNLENFQCIMHVNKSGILDGMKYSGDTDVTIPAALTGEAEKKLGMKIAFQVDILSAGSAVEVPVPDTEGF